MRIGDYARSVRHTFSSNRGRSALTLLGIMIGSGSIVLLAGLMSGGQEALLSTEQAASEADIVRISPDEAPAKMRDKTRREMTMLDQSLLSDSRLLGHTPTVALDFRPGEVHYLGRKTQVSLNGLTPDTVNLYRLKVQIGRFINDDDILQRRRVCVLGHAVWETVLEKTTDIDHVEIDVEGHLWRVVGVIQDKPPLGGDFGNWSWNHRVLVPNTTFDSLYAVGHQTGTIFVRAGASDTLGKDIDSQMGVIKGVVGNTLLRRHLGVKNFRVDGGEGDVTNRDVILGVIKVLLLGTGLLSLFVGGINIMNIMLVTVTERTREIGVRRAIGATPTQVMLQFLLEAAFIALTGGLIGVGGGALASWAAAWGLSHAFGSWPLHIEPWSVFLGLALSAITGVIFGWFPAWRAARLDPVEALRYE